MRNLILSLSRSGSTALYYEIMAALPDPMESFFEPNLADLLSRDLPENTIAKITIDTLSFSELSNLTNRFERTILIQRDPRDRLVSSFLFSMHGVDSSILKRRLDILDKKRNAPSQIPFYELILMIYPNLSKKFILNHVQGALNAFDAASRSTDTYYLLCYEDFINNSIEDLWAYLNLRPPTKVKLPQRHQYGKRRIIAGDWKNWFTVEDISFFRPVLDLFLNKNYLHYDWELSENPIIEKVYSTEFVSNAHMSDQMLRKSDIYWRD